MVLRQRVFLASSTKVTAANTMAFDQKLFPWARCEMSRSLPQPDRPFGRYPRICVTAPSNASVDISSRSASIFKYGKEPEKKKRKQACALSYIAMKQARLRLIARSEVISLKPVAAKAIGKPIATFYITYQK